MKNFFKIALGVSIVIVITLGVLFMTPQGRQAAQQGYLRAKTPTLPFNPADAVSPPDYSNDDFWAALPAKQDPSDLVPEGIDNIYSGSNAPVDVFYIHPTGYLSGASWTSPMDPNSAAEENTKWMLANQASAFNGCCNIYAPRYREATIYTYMVDAEDRAPILDFAYQDVARAFDYYIKHFNPKRRPFIIASHSQGTHHARRLIKEKIDGTPLFNRFVAGYTIGSVMIEYSTSYFAGLSQVKPCETAWTTGCIVHWDTFSDRGTGYERTENALCTNPLSWHNDEELAPAKTNLGALPIRIPYNLSFDDDNRPTGVEFTGLPAPIAGHASAQCRDGTLYVPEQTGEPFPGQSPEGNYHGLDYALFYMNIRENAKLRVGTFLFNTAQ